LTETITHHLVVESIRFFVFFFGFMPMPILVLTIIAAQTAVAAALS